MPDAGLSRRGAYAILAGGSLLMGAAAPLLALWGHELSPALMVLSVWTLLPLVSFFLPLLCSMRGCEPYLCFFPPGLLTFFSWLALRLPLPGLSLALSLLLGVIGGAWGAERCRRRPGKAAA
ncbi:MAG: hypothetical protein AB9880_06260 [Christensenellales bacterium]